MEVQDILDEVKSLGRVTTSDDDDILIHYIDILSSEALFYTQCPVLTPALEDLVVNYTLKFYRSDALNDAKNVSGIKRGDTQTQFKTEGTNVQEDLLNSFRNSLKPYKIIRGVI